MIKTDTNTEAFPDQARNYRLLMQRWHALTRRIPSLGLSLFGEAEGYPLMVIESDSQNPLFPSVYLSAGIHGDEPAAVEGLIRWAEGMPKELLSWNWQIFPCLNPWGLERNIRFDSEGRDLNRWYHSRRVPQIAAQLAMMKGRCFDLALTLHEDYDSRGFYLYEVAASRPYWGEALCKELSKVLPADNRKMIDGHAVRDGVIRKRITATLMKGHPEAFRLHLHHAKRTFTLETPSEAGLDRRILLQRKFLEIAVKKLKPEMVLRRKRG